MRTRLVQPSKQFEDDRKACTGEDKQKALKIGLRLMKFDNLMTASNILRRQKLGLREDVY